MHPASDAQRYMDICQFFYFLFFQPIKNLTLLYASVTLHEITFLLLEYPFFEYFANYCSNAARVPCKEKKSFFIILLHHRLSKVVNM